tara:strand:+ start:20196 stop:20546 length:351 start_codon:yes stop_codon:yes gene_type:complete
MAMSKYRWIYTTWPDQAVAETAATTLVEEGLCACANILPAGVSVYRWEGQIERDAETVMILKTGAEVSAALAERIAALHPYDEPCILALAIDDAASAPGFLRWIDGAVRTRPGSLG